MKVNTPLRDDIMGHLIVAGSLAQIRLIYVYIPLSVMLFWAGLGPTSEADVKERTNVLKHRRGRRLEMARVLVEEIHLSSRGRFRSHGGVQYCAVLSN